MRIKDVNGIINDLANLRDYRNPLAHVFIDKKFEMNLLTGKTNRSENKLDSIHELCTEKRNWFIERIKTLGGKLSDFEKAKITVFGAEESIEIVYKNKIFKKEVFYKKFGNHSWSKKFE